MRFAAIIVALIWLTACAPSAPPQPRPTATSPPPHPYVGSSVRVTQSFLTPDRDAFRQWTNYANENDQPSMQQMLKDGKAFQLANDTDVLVLDLNWGVDARVKVLSGPHAGRDGWLAFSRLKLPEIR